MYTEGKKLRPMSSDHISTVNSADSVSTLPNTSMATDRPCEVQVNTKSPAIVAKIKEWYEDMESRYTTSPDLACDKDDKQEDSDILKTWHKEKRMLCSYFTALDPAELLKVTEAQVYQMQLPPFIANKLLDEIKKLRRKDWRLVFEVTENDTRMTCHNWPLVLTQWCTGSDFVASPFLVKTLQRCAEKDEPHECLRLKLKENTSIIGITAALVLTIGASIIVNQGLYSDSSSSSSSGASAASNSTLTSDTPDFSTPMSWGYKTTRSCMAVIILSAASISTALMSVLLSGEYYTRTNDWPDRTLPRLAAKVLSPTFLANPIGFLIQPFNLLVVSIVLLLVTIALIPYAYGKGPALDATFWWDMVSYSVAVVLGVGGVVALLRRFWLYHQLVQHGGKIDHKDADLAHTRRAYYPLCEVVNKQDRKPTLC